MAGFLKKMKKKVIFRSILMCTLKKHIDQDNLQASLSWSVVQYITQEIQMSEKGLLLLLLLHK